MRRPTPLVGLQAAAADSQGDRGSTAFVPSQPASRQAQPKSKCHLPSSLPLGPGLCADVCGDGCIRDGLLKFQQAGSQRDGRFGAAVLLKQRGDGEGRSAEGGGKPHRRKGQLVAGTMSSRVASISRKSSTALRGQRMHARAVWV